MIWQSDIKEGDNMKCEVKGCNNGGDSTDICAGYKTYGLVLCDEHEGYVRRVLKNRSWK